MIVGSLIVFMAIFGLTLGPVVWLYIPEFVTPGIIPFSTLLNWVGCTICLLGFPPIKSALPDKNPDYIFLFFLLFMFVSLPVNAWALVETKNKSR